MKGNEKKREKGEKGEKRTEYGENWEMNFSHLVDWAKSGSECGSDDVQNSQKKLEVSLWEENRWKAVGCSSMIKEISPTSLPSPPPSLPPPSHLHQQKEDKQK